MKIKLAGISPNTLVNGEGLRTVLFAQGCKHNCNGCFSPFTHSLDGGMEFETKDIANKINKNKLKNIGVTFSGGDPFEQAEAFCNLAKSLDNKNIWCYTGYTFEEILNSNDEWKTKLLKYIDVLVDGKFESDKYDPNLKYKGSKNQRIIDVQASLKNNKIILWRKKND